MLLAIACTGTIAEASVVLKSLGDGAGDELVGLGGKDPPLELSRERGLGRVATG